MAVDSAAATAIAEAFFSLDDGSRELAKQVCDGCSVRSQCLTEAITAGYDDGIWGGLEPEERRVMRRVVRDRGAVA